MNVDFSGHTAQNDFESDSCMDSGTDSDADSSSGSGSSLGDVFDSDDSSDSDEAGDGGSANDQCVDIIWAKAARGVWGFGHQGNSGGMQAALSDCVVTHPCNQVDQNFCLGRGEAWKQRDTSPPPCVSTLKVRKPMVRRVSQPSSTCAL